MKIVLYDDYKVGLLKGGNGVDGDGHDAEATPVGTLGCGMVCEPAR